MTIRAVVWDVDDTLFDYTAADRQGMRDHLAAEGLLAWYGGADKALQWWRECTDQQWARFAAGENTFEGQRRDRVRYFLGEQLADVEADAWFGRYLRHYEAAWRLFPDVLPVLDALAADHRQAVLSNSSLTVQEHKLRTLGVLDRFETVLCAAELGVSKPEAGAFLAACEALGLPPHEVAYVGDHPEIDGRGAAEAGLLSVWIDRGTAHEDTAGGGVVSYEDASGRLVVAREDAEGGVVLAREEVAVAVGAHRISTLAELPALVRADTRFGAPSTFR